MTTSDAPATHLLIINAHEPLAWVLENQRMAFPMPTAPSIPSPSERATRSCCTPHAAASETRPGTSDA